MGSKRPKRRLSRSRRGPRSRSSRPASVFHPPSFIYAAAHYQREYEQKSQRALENLELRDRLEQLRRYVKGFETSRFDLRKINKWSDKTRTEVTESSKRLRNLLATSHISVPVPRSKSKKRSLKFFTHQDPREMKRFIVFTEAPEKTKLVFSKRGQVQLEIKSGPKTSYTREFFLWSDFDNGKHPVTLAQQRRVLKRMLKVMPEGRYAFWTLTHGMTGKPQEKRFLMDVLTDWYHAYESGPYAFRHEGFGKILSGLVYLGTWKSMRQAEMRREKQKRKYQNDVRIRSVSRRRTVRVTRRKIAKQIVKKAMTRASKKPVRKK